MKPAALTIAFCLCTAACSKAPPHTTIPASDTDGSVSGNADLTMMACASADFTAQQAPAAMLVVLDRSTSMSANNKYNFAAQAIVQAIDQDIFDSMSIGLYSAPNANVAGPDCVFNLAVACGVPPFPQIDLALAGANKSGAANGVRHDIKTWLASNTADNSPGAGDPLYDAIQSALSALQAWPQSGKRILFVVTDGAIDCTSLSNRAGYMDCNMCNDWEDPGNIITLLATANKDPQTPVDTFIVGVPGADTIGQSCDYPPYAMRLALSAMAYAGSPNNVPANCTGKAFTQAGGNPTVSCHFDLTQGNFSAAEMQKEISQIRGQVLGCTFELPMPDMGTIDPGSVNVTVTEGGMSVELPKRADPTNTCLTGDGCWDYDMNGKVVLEGVACTNLTNAMIADVHIVVGCPTVIE